MSAPASERLFGDAIAAADRANGDDAGAPAPAAVRDTRAAGRYVLFAIGATSYAVPEAHVTELERVPRLTPVPRVPAWLRGVTNLRGDIVSVVDLRIYLGLSGVLPPSARLLVVRLLDEPFATGLIVDAVDRIVTVNAADITPPAAPLEGPLTPYLAGVCTANERLVAVLDIARLLRAPDLRQFEEPRSVDAAAPADLH
jgi:purine-binding chemotaxis protein CheW